MSGEMNGVPRTTADAVTFATLFERHQRHVLAYCVRRTSRLADAEDAAAEAFVVAWRRRRDAPDVDEALPWLYGIARRILANHRRANERRHRLSLRMPVTVSEPVLAGQAAGAAIEALARLKTDDQELLRLVAWEGLDQGEIAQVLGISVNAVAIRLHRARIRFELEFRAESNPDDLKGIVGRRTSTRLKGRMIGLLRREPTK